MKGILPGGRTGTIIIAAAVAFFVGGYLVKKGRESSKPADSLAGKAGWI